MIKTRTQENNDEIIAATLKAVTITHAGRWFGPYNFKVTGVDNSMWCYRRSVRIDTKNPELITVEQITPDANHILSYILHASAITSSFSHHEWPCGHNDRDKRGHNEWQDKLDQLCTVLSV